MSDGRGRIYANLADKDVIAAIDTRTLEVKSRWPVAPAGEPTALAIDREHRRLFSAGRKPAMLVILNADTGQAVQSFPISNGTDAAAYDAKSRTIFVSTIEGKIHVFHEDSPNQFSILPTITSEFGAKTMGLDAKTGRLFLDTADFGQPVASTDGRPARRWPMLGTFRVLVYGR